jgi:hypothetical protein
MMMKLHVKLILKNFELIIQNLKIIYLVSPYFKTHAVLSSTYIQPPLYVLVPKPISNEAMLTRYLLLRWMGIQFIFW